MLVEKSLLILLLLSIPSGGVAITISTSRLFRPFRLWLDSREFIMLANLVECHYCLGHWTALFFYIITPNIGIETGNWFSNLFVNYFLLVGLTSFVSITMLLGISLIKKLEK